MPITITLGQIAVKDANGNYVHFDMVTQANMDEIIEKKDEAVEEINAVANSVPKSYSKMNEDVQKLGRDYETITNDGIDYIIEHCED